MSRTATPPRPAASSSAAASPDEAAASRREGHRETVEALVVAFILALLVRGFAAEAFVIPTGSMAPTLMGRHKEVTCPECGHVYAVNASEEVEGVASDRLAERRVHTGICVNCRFQTRIDREPSFKGDRILVMKFPYDMSFLPGASPPRRWDVVVFRYPEEPETSYIKRLVGLPGEELRVWFGDLLIKPPGGDTFRLEQKPLMHQRAMQMLVYDDTHRARKLDGPEWRRWSSASTSAWREESEGDAEDRRYRYVSAASPGSEWAELRYRHLVPDPEQWNAILEDRTLPRLPARR
jgi:signal peptidase I